MSNCADAACPSPDEGLREVVPILAVGVLRLRHRNALAAESSLDPAEL